MEPQTDGWVLEYSVLRCSWNPYQGVQPMAFGPHAAQDGYECGPTQNRKFT